MRVTAWNAEGHMVVAQIAYIHLDAAVKSRCDALIAVILPNASSASTNFITASCWADDFKSSIGNGTSHYIDIPFSLDGTPTNSFVPPVFDVVQALRQNIATLQSTNAVQTNLATNLRYLLHFVGDIQQPLHCSTAISASKPGGDAGGNGFSVTDWGNLHSLWDSGGGFLSDSVSRPLSAAAKTILSNKVSSIEAVYPYIRNTGNIPDPMTWASSGLGLAQTVSYVGITNNTSPTTNYLNTTMATAEQLMAQGGHRLADLLNTIFASNPFSLTSVTRTNGNFRFSWAANGGKIYRVQWKQQLNATAWNDLTNFTATGTSASFTETATQQQRFYRVIQLN
jgi:hypothetical protein